MKKRITAGWMGRTPEHPAGITWGVPWAAGELQRDEVLGLEEIGGSEVRLQSWPTAYWPDGSVKWTAHAASIHAPAVAGYSVIRTGRAADSGTASASASAEADQAPGGIRVEETEEGIRVDTGAVIFRLNRSGEELIRSIHRGSSELCSGGRLTGLREEEHLLEGGRVIKQTTFTSQIHSAVIEQRGPVRAVIRIAGRHRLHAAAREWLPFSLRLYFYEGQESVRIVHTFTYDGDPQRDGIRGLGLLFRVPMAGPLYNRHVRFAGDTGIFSESPKTLMTYRTQGKYDELYRRQTAGEAVSFDPAEDARFIGLLEESAVWDQFKLVQGGADEYSISKRTQEGCTWLRAVSGRRAQGLIYAGGANGGLAAAVRNFWQKFPSSLEVSGMSGDTAELKIWFWSPDAPAMDLRHYDTRTHLESSYEGFHELRSTPYGVGNTNELYLWCVESTPSREELVSMAGMAQQPPLLVCEPVRYHETGAFGLWSLPDRSSRLHALLEDRLDEAITFYQEEIERRRWYGFWDYGDVMHSYDPVRHTWRYDIGGCAWQNTELVPNMWLWLMFLRSGREDVFRLAEAMTRHTSEVDTYHYGEYAGLGSRHNVVHWGCGCKEARISMAGLHRYFYYLTGDERTGEIMEEVLDSDYTTVNLDPMRSYFPKDEFPTHARVGPDWSAFCSNWMTRWERFEDTAYRDKLLVGWESMKRMPFRLLTGPAFGYDPKTGELHHMSNDNWGRHLMICMGGPQIWMELAETLQDETWKDMLAEFGAFYPLSREQKAERTGGEIHKHNWDHPLFFSGLMAYASARQQQPELAEQAWRIILRDPVMGEGLAAPQHVDPLQFVRSMVEFPDISTNVVSQWCLNTILCLELIGAHLPGMDGQEPVQESESVRR